MKNYISFAVYICLFMMINSAHSATIYEYTGNNYTSIVEDSTPPNGAYTLDMSVSGNFEVSSPLIQMTLMDISASVLSYSFFDGRTTLTNLNSVIDIFEIETNTSGQITHWNIEVEKPLSTVTSIGDQFLIIGTVNTPLLITEDVGVISECTSTPCDGFFSRQSDVATNLSSPGSWAAPVPIPGAIWLFGSALGFMGLLRKHS